MIEVLWIDDECKLDSGEFSPMGQEFIEHAYNEGIKITPFLTYDEGVAAIRDNPLRWCAVILDIHNQKSTAGKPSDGFSKAKDDIIRIQVENHQLEPYVFVLSGNKLYHTENNILRKEQHCSKVVYDKNSGDYKILFEDIQKIKNVSSLYSCQNQYSDVLSVIKKLCGDESWKRMFQLLYEITIKNENNDPALFNTMRKVLEDIMNALEKIEYPYFNNQNDKKTLNNLSVYVGNDNSVPEYIKRSFHTLVRVVQDGSHSKTVNNRMDVDYDVINLKAPYLLRSSLYELCNIIIWMREVMLNSNYGTFSEEEQ